MTKSDVVSLEVVPVGAVVVIETQINPQDEPPQNPYLVVAPGETYDFKVWVKNTTDRTITETVQLTQDGEDIPNKSHTFNNVAPGEERNYTFTSVTAPSTTGKYLIGARAWEVV